MAAAFIEHRPKSTDKETAVSYFAVVSGGKDVDTYKTQAAARDAACADGYRPVHVARVRHLNDRDKPDHWRVDPC